MNFKVESNGARIGLAQMYRLVKATLAVLRNADQQAFQVLPKGSIVLVEGSSAADRVNIRWENRELWMFTTDLRRRGTPLYPRTEESLGGGPLLPNGQ
jgi:hypothetical protein